MQLIVRSLKLFDVAALDNRDLEVLSRLNKPAVYHILRFDLIQYMVSMLDTYNLWAKPTCHKTVIDWGAELPLTGYNAEIKYIYQIVGWFRYNTTYFLQITNYRYLKAPIC